MHIFIIIFLLIISVLTIIIPKYNKYYENRIIKEIEDAVIVDNGKVLKENENKLVYVTGRINYTGESLYDDMFNISSNTSRLLRKVEVYQWYEIRNVDENGNVTHTYGRGWSSSLFDSSKFHDKSYKNPTEKPINTKSYNHENVMVGEYVIPDKLLNEIPCKNKINLSEDTYIPEGFKIYDDYITNSKDMNNPEIGDIRISFYRSDWVYAHVLAKQKNSSFEKFITKDHGKIIVVLPIYQNLSYITKNLNKYIKY